MSQSERLYKIDRLLQAHACVPLNRMLEELRVSRATFKRDIEYMRSRLHAPIEWDRSEQGYKYVGQIDGRQQAALPGLWFNSSEAYALLMMQALLTEMTPGLLGAHIEPLKARLRAIIETGQHAADEVEGKVRLLNVATRSVPDKDFELVHAATVVAVHMPAASWKSSQAGLGRAGFIALRRKVGCGNRAVSHRLSSANLLSKIPTR